MKLKNILLVVQDIEESKAFYKDLFGLPVVMDFGENVILLEGLVLQQKNLWEKSIEKEVIFSGHDAELYFEENDMDRFLQKLENSRYPVEYITKDQINEAGQRVIRIYDPDHHIIEIKEERKWKDCVQNV